MHSAPDTFAAFSFSAPIAQALTECGLTKPTPIQIQAIPPILAGRDVVGVAQTGTGKTAAFVLPILERLAREPAPQTRSAPRALILVPTRELAQQVGERITAYGAHLNLTFVTLFGGVHQGPQEHALARRVDIVVATPGRFLDLMRQNIVHVSGVQVLVLDEADRMLDMGFAEDIARIANSIPEKRQTLLFSATLSDRIASLTHQYLHNPLRIAVTTQATTVGKVTQTVYFVDPEDKMKLLFRILESDGVTRGIIFVRMKYHADKVVLKLLGEKIAAAALHSDKTMTMRTQAMEDFRSGKVRILVATDIAARGLDVDGITHVINYDLPNDPETYVHRIGRTGRAGAVGTALTFCSATDRKFLDAIEKLIAKHLVVREHKYSSAFAESGGEMSTRPKPAKAAAKTGRGGGKGKIAENGNTQGSSVGGWRKRADGHLARQSNKWKQK